MSKQKIKIEVDVPEGFETTGSLKPQPYVTNVDTCEGALLSVCAIYQLRKLPPKPTFPDWFPSGWWIARLRSGGWYAFLSSPETYSSGWRARDSVYMPLRDMSTFANLPDASVPWTECCYQCVRSEE